MASTRSGRDRASLQEIKEVWASLPCDERREVLCVRDQDVVGRIVEALRALQKSHEACLAAGFKLCDDEGDPFKSSALLGDVLNFQASAGRWKRHPSSLIVYDDCLELQIKDSFLESKDIFKELTAVLPDFLAPASQSRRMPLKAPRWKQLWEVLPVTFQDLELRLAKTIEQCFWAMGNRRSRTDAQDTTKPSEVPLEAWMMQEESGGHGTPAGTERGKRQRRLEKKKEKKKKAKSEPVPVQEAIDVESSPSDAEATPKHSDDEVDDFEEVLKNNGEHEDGAEKKDKEEEREASEEQEDQEPEAEEDTKMVAHMERIKSATSTYCPSSCDTDDGASEERLEDAPTAVESVDALELFDQPDDIWDATFSKRDSAEIPMMWDEPQSGRLSVASTDNKNSVYDEQGAQPAYVLLNDLMEAANSSTCSGDRSRSLPVPPLAGPPLLDFEPPPGLSPPPGFSPPPGLPEAALLAAPPPGLIASQMAAGREGFSELGEALAALLRLNLDEFKAPSSCSAVDAQARAVIDDVCRLKRHLGLA